MNFFKLFLTVAMCFYPLLTFSQTNQEAPEVLVQRYWNALKASDWTTATTLVHPESLKRVRTSSDKFVDTLTTLGEGNLNSYFQVSTKEEYAKLSDAAVFERLQQSFAERPGHKEVLAATKFSVIGNLKETNDLVHVLYRSDVELRDSQGRRLEVANFEERGELIGVKVEVKLPKPKPHQATVISVKKHDAGWRILLNDEMENMLGELENSIKEFQGHMKTFAEEVVRQNTKSKRHQKTRRTTLKP